jgi:uncharacterized membrane protein
MSRPTIDSRTRALAKATTWRLLATAITAACAWLVTGEIACAASIGALDTLVKFGSYYFHERLWDRASLERDELTYPRTP